MKTNFSPSVNIIRDFDKELNYIPTENANRVFKQIIGDFQTGTHAFNIIGSYGTGKSAFLWAFAKQLTDKHDFFGSINSRFSEIRQYHFWNIVGDYVSISDAFHDYVLSQEARSRTKDVFKNLKKLVTKLHSNNGLLVIVIDEFGKFLEYAAKNDPEKELFFVQKLAEFVNDDNNNILLITTLHQGFDAYSRTLDKAQRHEWEKVKGRLKEITFNEPIEQLLQLAAERISKQLPEKPTARINNALVELINNHRVFPANVELNSRFTEAIYPFDPVAAGILSRAIQDYGQNERSLFTFLNSSDEGSLSNFDRKQNPYYNLVCVYDYLQSSYYHALISKYNNPHQSKWGSIRTAIERIEGSFKKNYSEAISLIKVIGLLTIYTRADARFDSDFLAQYGRFCLGIENADEIIDKLERLKIIKFRSVTQRYIPFEGTDLDLESALIDAATKVDPITDTVTPLKKYFDFPYISAKAATYEYGTPRFFQFELTEEPIQDIPEGEIDGTINLIFSDKIKPSSLVEASKKAHPAILYGLYKNTQEIKRTLFEIKKTEKVISDNKDDKPALNELEVILDHERETLNRQVMAGLYVPKGDIVVWVYNGKMVSIDSGAEFNSMLSKICADAYPDTPVFRNELMNRHKYSTPISTARKNYFGALIENWYKEDLGFPKNNFPPEKTIYLALLKKTGIHRQEQTSYIIDRPTDQSFEPIWQCCEIFLSKSKVARLRLIDLIDQLSASPFKLKQGFIEFWLPTYLFIRRGDFALYHENVFQPELNESVFELLYKEPEKFQIKAFDVQGVKLNLFNRYREFISKEPLLRADKDNFIQTVTPFLNFYKQLPDYTKRTNRLEKSAIRLRDAIAKADDPEKLFFQEFPTALGYGQLEFDNMNDDQLQDYVNQLNTNLQELQTAFDDLVNRIESFLLGRLGYIGEQFPTYRRTILKRFEAIKEYSLLPYQKTFYLRLKSELEDRKLWFSSLVQDLIHKSLNEIRDEEEELIFDKLDNIISELDNLCDINKIKIDEDKQDVFKVDITRPGQKRFEEIVVFSKQKEKEALNLERDLKQILAKYKDRSLIKKVLTKLIQEIINL